jgi:hypothetical protein
MSRNKHRAIPTDRKEELDEVLNRLAVWLAVVSSEGAVKQPRPARGHGRTPARDDFGQAS